MNAQVMGTRLWKYSWCRALAGLGLIAWTSLAAAQNTINAGDLSDATAGQPAVVTITLTLGGTAQANVFGAVFTAVPQGDAPRITSKLVYTALDPLPAPDINSNSSVPKVSINYLTPLSPTLTGTQQIGTLTVPIPTGAEGSTYQIQVSQVGVGYETCANAHTTICAVAGDCPQTGDCATRNCCTFINKLDSTGQPGTITVSGVAGPSATPTQAVLLTSTPTSATLPTSTPTTALPSVTATEPPATATSTALPGGPTPTVTPSAAATATGTAVPTVTAAVAAASAGDTVLTLQNAPSDFPSSGTITVIGNEPLSAPIPFTRSGDTLNLLNAGGLPSDVQDSTTITVVPAGPEATATPTTVAPTGVTPTAIAPTTPAGGASAGGGGGGCRIDVTDRNATWMLAGLVLGVLMARRRHR
jgi:hypothetical protein